MEIEQNEASAEKVELNKVSTVESAYDLVSQKEEVDSLVTKKLEVKGSVLADLAPVNKKEDEKIALVYSAQDPAGQLIFEKIKEIGVPSWAVPYQFNEDIVDVKLARVKENKVVFLSRHASASSTKSLTVHMIGNFGEAKFGGRSMELCRSLAWIGANYLRALNRKNISSGLNKQGFVVSYEATHHGPFTNKLCVFIELGSTPLDWKNELGAKIIAQTVVESTLTRSPDTIAIGLGGGHYSPDFTKLTLKKGYAFGHICPKHQLGNLNRNLIKQMIGRSRANVIILDWKGLKENKDHIVALCEDTGLPFEKVQNLLK